MSGPAVHKPRLWRDIIGDPDKPEAGGIYMGTPEPLKRFLGCDHKVTTQTASDGTKVRRIEYDMQPFFEGCLRRYEALTGIIAGDLPKVSTPFLDEDAVRKAQGIGPMGFKLPTTKVSAPQAKKPGKGAKVPLATPGSTKVDAEGKVPTGVLQPIAASCLMQVLYGARFARPDLLRAVAALARKITKWTQMCDPPVAQADELHSVKPRLPAVRLGWR